MSYYRKLSLVMRMEDNEDVDGVTEAIAEYADALIVGNEEVLTYVKDDETGMDKPNLLWIDAEKFFSHIP